MVPAIDRNLGGVVSRVCIGAVGAFLLGTLSCARPPGESPTRGRLSVVAAESHAPLVRREADLFNSLYAEAHVSVRPATTREAIVALLADSVKLIAVDRPPNEEERQAIAQLGLPIEELRVAEDALALLVNSSNRLESVSIDLAADLLSGRAAEWDGVPGSGLSGAVERVATGRNSGAWELLAGRFFTGSGLAAPTVVAASQREVLERVAANPAALGVASVAAWREPSANERAPEAGDVAAGWARGVGASPAEPSLRALAISRTDSLGKPMPGVLHQANIHTGDYPLHYPVYLLFNKDSLLATGFCAFVASAPGQKLILESGLVPARMPVRLVQLK
jgi:phosphate transport system substrate-binding protein